MFFQDESKSKQNQNKIANRNDFLSKLQTDKDEVKRKALKKESIDKLGKYMFIIKSKYYPIKKVTEKLKNLKSVSTLLSAKKLSDNQIDKLILTCFDKMKNEIKDIYSSFNNNHYKETTDFLIEFFELINRVSDKPTITKYINDNDFMISLMIITLLIKIYYDICVNKKLLDEFNILGKLLITVYNVIDKNNALHVVFKRMGLSRNIGYFFKRILENLGKIIDQRVIQILILIGIGVSSEIIVISNKHQTLFCDIAISQYIDLYSKNVFNNNSKTIFSLDLIMKIMRKTNDLSPIEHLNSALIITILSSDFYVKGILEKKELTLKAYQQYLNELTQIFNILSQKNICYQNVSFNKQELIVRVLLILEIAFEIKLKSNSISCKSDQLRMTKSKIILISSTLKLFLSIYTQSQESIPSQSILDYIFNKSITKNNKNLLDEIITYSHETFVIPEYNNKKNMRNFNNNPLFNSSNITSSIYKKYFTPEEISIIEIISFSIDQKIQYKSDNYLPVLLNKKFKNISENIPFNPYYLREMSSLIIRVFVFMLGNSNTSHDKNEYFKELSNSLIVETLKSVYELDNSVEFSYDKDEFWSNSELINKILSFDKSQQLEIIKIIPFVFSIKFRIDCFYSLINTNKRSNRELLLLAGMGHDIPMLDLKICRLNLFDQSLSLYLEGYLKYDIPWKVTFVNKFGMTEDGQDAGGLFMEYLMKLSEEAFSKEIGFFVESTTGFLVPNSNSDRVSDYHLQVFEFLGFIVGVSIVNETQIWPNLCTFFLNNVLGVSNPFIELKNYDQDLYKNLITLMDYEGDIENDFMLNFTVIEKLGDGKIIEKELIPNGRNTNVNNDNKLLYIRRITQYKLEVQFKPQCEAFKTGLQKVIDEDYYKLFTANDLRQIIAGFDQEINLVDWKMNTIYNFFNMSNKNDVKVINDFWEIVWEMDVKDTERLLFFVTSMKRPPLSVRYCFVIFIISIFFLFFLLYRASKLLILNLILQNQINLFLLLLLVLINLNFPYFQKMN